MERELLPPPRDPLFTGVKMLAHHVLNHVPVKKHGIINRTARTGPIAMPDDFPTSHIVFAGINTSLDPRKPDTGFVTAYHYPDDQNSESILKTKISWVDDSFSLEGPYTSQQELAVTELSALQIAATCTQVTLPLDVIVAGINRREVSL